MLERFRNALVSSFVGGHCPRLDIFTRYSALCIHFHRPNCRLAGATRISRTRGALHQFIVFSMQDALPELVKSFALVLVGYLLLRWLYFKPLGEATDQPLREGPTLLTRPGTHSPSPSTAPHDS
jgi:hypothetical protein